MFQTQERPVVRTDNGPQFISHVFEEACLKHETIHERIPPRTPNKNAHIESIHSVLESECLQKHEFTTYQEAYSVVTAYIEFYNKRRMHGSLNDLAPEQFRKAVATGQECPKIIKV